MPGRALGAAAGGTLALAVLVCGCVFACLAGPKVSLHQRTEALQQSVGRPGTQATSVEADASWSAFPQPFDGELAFTGYSFALATSQIEAGLAYSLPIAQGWWGSLTTRLHMVSSGTGRLPDGYPAQLEVTYRDQLASYIQVVAGRVSGPAVPAGALGVAVTEQTAARFGLHPGSRVDLSGPAGPVVLLITAVVRERDPASGFWTADPLASGPALALPPGGGGSAAWQGAVLADPGQLGALQNAFCAVGGASCDSMQLRWEFPVDLGSVTADQAQALLNDLAGTGPGLYEQLGPAANVLVVSSPLTGTLATFVATQAAVLSVLLLLFVSLIAIGAAVIMLAAWMMAVRRDAELTMLRARGASRPQVARRMLASSVLAAGLGTAAGAVLAGVLIPGPSEALGRAMAAAVAVIALSGPPLIAAWRHRRAGPAVNPAQIVTAETALARFSPAARRRLVAGLTVCAAAAAGLIALRDQGLPSAGNINWYLTAAPILVALPAALIAMRVYPLAVRALLHAWHRRRGATGYVALADSAASGTALTLPAVTLVLALTLAACAGMVTGAIADGQTAYSWQVTGADAVITTNGALGAATPAVQQSIMTVPGVRHVTAVWTTTWRTPLGQQLTVAAVDPAGYAALTADTPFPGVPAGAFGPVAGPASVTGVLASPSAAAALGAGAVQLTSPEFTGPVRIRVAGTVAASTPALPGGGAFVLVPLRALPALLGRPQPNLILITGARLDQARLSRLVAGALPGASLAFRADAISSLRSVPLLHAAALLMTLTVAAAAGLALLSLIFGLALGTRDRQLTLARLSVMGYERATALVLLAALPALLAAFAAAAACALALPALIGPALDLSVFTGPGAAVTFRPDLAALGLPFVAIALLAGAVLAVEASQTRRRGVAGLVRVI
jgi:putative ABC transport system permease protein